jgi:hypothetical protein
MRALVPAMAAGKVGMPGFLHGTWTLDGHAVLVFEDENSARRYHDDMRSKGAIEAPGQRCIAFDVAEVGAESRAGDVQTPSVQDGR